MTDRKTLTACEVHGAVFDLSRRCPDCDRPLRNVDYVPAVELERLREENEAMRRAEAVARAAAHSPVDDEVERLREKRSEAVHELSRVIGRASCRERVSCCV